MSCMYDIGYATQHTVITRLFIQTHATAMYALHDPLPLIMFFFVCKLIQSHAPYFICAYIKKILCIAIYTGLHSTTPTIAGGP